MLNILKCVAVAALLGVSASAKDAVLPRDGAYFNTVFLAKLTKTKSLHKSWSGNDPQAILVSRDKGALQLDLVINWHEGDRASFDLANPAKQIRVAGESDKTFTPQDVTHFAFQDSGGKHAYLFVGNDQQFLIDTLIAGTYADARGRRYVFSRDGKAQFPDRSFRYEIYSDMVFENCDLITDKDETERHRLRNYGFAWKGDALYIYDANCWVDDRPGCVVDRAHPIAVLHKLTLKK